MEIEQINWADAKPKLDTVNPKLSAIIDQYPFTKKFPLYLINYKYGTVTGSDETGFVYPKGPFGKLWGHYTPFSVVMDKKFEMYIELNKNRPISYRLYKKGMVFNSSQFIERRRDFLIGNIFKIAAGARTAFLLPHISEVLLHRNLINYFGNPIQLPQNINQHGLVFKEIAEAGNCPWRAKLLCFSNEWVECVKEQRPHDFYDYINGFANDIDAYSRISPLYNYLLDFIRCNNQLIPSNTFVFEQVKQFFGMGCGKVPGYSPSTNDDFVPSRFISECYENIYKVESSPFMMEPAYFEMNKNPLYYSSSKENLVIKPKGIPNILKLSNIVRESFNLFASETEKLAVDPASIFRKCADNLELTVLHNRASNYDTVINSKADLFKYDERFKTIATTFEKRYLLEGSGSQFFVGCIGMKSKDHRF